MYGIEMDDDDVFAAQSSSIVKTCITWYHHGNEVKSFTTSMEIKLRHVGNVGKTKVIAMNL